MESVKYVLTVIKKNMKEEGKIKVTKYEETLNVGGGNSGRHSHLILKCIY